MVKKISGFPALSCLAAGLLLVALPTHAEVKQGAAVVKTLTGTASSVDAFGFSHPLRVGSVVKPGETVQTGANSTVDFFLDQNGPGIGLNPESTLRFDQLTYEQSALGTVIATRLDLRQGALFGTVKKLAAGSRFEVKTPQGVATVRGTEFYIDAQQGTLYVVTGTVLVHLVLNLDTGGTLNKDVSVGSGQYLSIPKTGTMQLWNNLAATPFSSKITATSLARLATLGQLMGPLSGSSATEVFDGSTSGTAVNIVKPPTSITVSP